MTQRKRQTNQKIHYGYDAPGFVLSAFAAGVIAAALGLCISYYFSNPVAQALGVLILIASLLPLSLAAMLVYYWFFGKFRIRDEIISMLKLGGTERVLDVGTGRGLLMIAAAKKLTTGQAVGIDIWNANDLSGNTAAACGENSKAEGVQGKVEILDQDATHMSFADGSFDAVVSLLCLHNIEPKEKRDKALFEIARVLKPGGRLVIGDYTLTGEYVEVCERAGLSVLFRKNYCLQACSLMWIVVAERPSDTSPAPQ